MEKDIFCGTSFYSKCCTAIYGALVRREEFTNTEIFGRVYNDNLETGERPFDPVSQSMSSFGGKRASFMKAKKYIFEEIRNRCGECIEITKKKKCIIYKYVGEDPDPLAGLCAEEHKRGAAKYMEFCHDSDGLVPRPWTDYFLCGTKHIQNIEDAPSWQYMSSDIADNLLHMDYLPIIYEAIKYKKVLKFTYTNFEGTSQETVFHPQYLKEYRGRWQVYGESKVRVGWERNGFCQIAMDRISTKPEFVETESYRTPPAARYQEYFEHLVGVSQDDVTLPSDIRKGINERYNVYDIRIRVFERYFCGLLETKKIHHSLRTIKKFGVHEDGTYAEMSLYVHANNELISELLLFGRNIQIVSPSSVVEYVKKYIRELKERYE